MELRLNLARDMPSAQYIFENVSDSDSLQDFNVTKERLDRVKCSLVDKRY